MNTVSNNSFGLRLTVH